MNPASQLHRQHATRPIGRIVRVAAALALGAVALVAQAQSSGFTPVSTMPAIYPAKGQSAQLQDKDKYQCYGWAKGQTGFDPMQGPPPAEPAPTSAQSASKQSAAGFARGAAVGAAVGELAHHDAGRGAAAGGLGGAAIARVQQRQAAQQQQERAAQQQTARSQQKATFYRAFDACMEARGYAVR